MTDIIPPKEKLNPEYNYIVVDDAILYSLQKIIDIEFYEEAEIEDPIRTIIIFRGITRIPIKDIPKGIEVQGRIDNEEVNIFTENDKGDIDREITFKVMIQNPILIFSKEKI